MSVMKIARITSHEFNLIVSETANGYVNELTLTQTIELCKEGDRAHANDWKEDQQVEWYGFLVPDSCKASRLVDGRRRWRTVFCQTYLLQDVIFAASSRGL